MELKIDVENNVVYIKLSGLLSKKVILGAFDLTVSDKRYKKGMGRLWDFRGADLSSLDSEAITAMAQYSLKFPPGINDVKVAFVTSTELEYGLSRMFENSSAAKTPIRVFRAMDPAEKWIKE
ncbi:MAG: hypothetical protein HKO68_10535 [Desulfobacterales bacterium]|nr:hypothetical protein [Desulfobacterales bacterium]